MTFNYLSIAFGLFLLFLAPVHAQVSLDSDETTPARSVLQVARSASDAFVSSTRNADFLNSRLDSSRLNTLKRIVGQRVFADRLNLGAFEGQTIGELLREKKDILLDHPQILAGLAASAQAGGATVYASDRADAPLEVPAPGRIISTRDLQNSLTGPFGSHDRFRSFLNDNFEMTDRQMDAFSTFLALANQDDAAPESGADGADRRSEDLDGIERLPVGGEEQNLGEDADSKGLYLPPESVLDQIASLTDFMNSYEEADSPNPGRFRDPSGRSLGDILDEHTVSGENPLSMWEMDALSADDVRRELMKRIRDIVKREKNGPNGYLFEKGLAYSMPASTGGGMGTLLNKIRLGRLARFAPIGNGEARTYNNKLYEALVIQNPNPDIRDSIELHSGGDFFAIRGRPTDVFTDDGAEPKKHYDPSIDSEGMLFGTGMNIIGSFQ